MKDTCYILLRYLEHSTEPRKPGLKSYATVSKLGQLSLALVALVHSAAWIRTRLQAVVDICVRSVFAHLLQRD